MNELSILTTGLLSSFENVRQTIFRLALILILAGLAAYPFAEHLLHFVKWPLGTALIMYAPLEDFLGHIEK